MYRSVFSAGVGRTGVFITLSIILERMRYEGVVDMFQTVKMLRTQRPAMVQTEVRQFHKILDGSGGGGGFQEGQGGRSAVSTQVQDALFCPEIEHQLKGVSCAWV